MIKIKSGSLILASCLLVGLSGCGNTENSNEIVQKGEIIENEAVVDIQEGTDSTGESKKDINIPNDSVVASEYIQSITSVEAYSEGKYVIMGMNNAGSNFCGVLYNNGMLKVYDEYFKVYPLKDGRLLATTDEKAKDMSYSISQIQNATVNGVIIDEMGNIIFSNENYLRFIPVNEDRLLVFNANSGFEGITFEFGIIDSDGKWICDLESNEISELFVNNVRISNDNTWQFIDSPYTDYTGFSEIYKIYGWQIISKDKNSVQIVVKTNKDQVYATGQIIAEDPDPIFVTYTYIPETDQIEKGIFNYILREQYEDLPVQSYAMMSNGQILFNNSWSQLLSSASYIQYNSEIYTLSGEKLEEVKGFYIGNDYYFDRDNGEIKNLVNGQALELNDSVLSHLQDIYEEKDIFYLILLGEDNQYYIERAEMDKEPVQLMYFNNSSKLGVLFFDDVLVYCNGNQKKIYIVDINTFDILDEIDCSVLGGSSFRLHKLDDEVFAVEERNRGTAADPNYFLIYDLNGKLIY